MTLSKVEAVIASAKDTPNKFANRPIIPSLITKLPGVIEKIIENITND